MIPHARVAGERCDGALVQRHHPQMVVLGVADQQPTVVEIDIVAVKSDRFSDAHPGNRQQADQRGVGRGLQGRGERAGCFDQPHDLAVGVEVSDRAMKACR